MAHHTGFGPGRKEAVWAKGYWACGEEAAHAGEASSSSCLAHEQDTGTAAPEVNNDAAATPAGGHGGDLREWTDLEAGAPDPCLMELQTAAEADHGGGAVPIERERER